MGLQPVGPEAEHDQHQAVPHPEQSPVLEDDGMVSFTEGSAEHLREL